jgi:hypothetical protein
MLYVFDYGAEPGIRATFESVENEFRWGRGEISVAFGARISGAARDAGSSPTTILRPGLALGKITASGLWKEYDATATDGSEVFQGILGGPAVRATDISGSNQNKLLAVIVAGPIKAAKVYGLDYLARSQSKGRFLFDDDLNAVQIGWRHEQAKTSDYTIVAADTGKLFTNTGATGAVTFTLPTLAAGLVFDFFVVADQNVTVASAAGDDMVIFNDVAADSAAFSTAGQLIGGRLRVTSNAAATKWYVENLSVNTLTVAT